MPEPKFIPCMQDQPMLLPPDIVVDGWYKVAMGNACNEVKALADMVTEDVISDGIWNACERLGLFDPVDDKEG